MNYCIAVSTRQVYVEYTKGQQDVFENLLRPKVIRFVFCQIFLSVCGISVLFFSFTIFDRFYCEVFGKFHKVLLFFYKIIGRRSLVYVYVMPIPHIVQQIPENILFICVFLELLDHRFFFFFGKISLDYFWLTTKKITTIILKNKS